MFVANFFIPRFEWNVYAFTKVATRFIVIIVNGKWHKRRQSDTSDSRCEIKMFQRSFLWWHLVKKSVECHQFCNKLGWKIQTFWFYLGPLLKSLTNSFLLRSSKSEKQEIELTKMSNQDFV